VARFQGGEVSREQLTREANRLPPSLREKLSTPDGERGFAESLVDRELLVQEARRRNLQADPEVRLQVQDLEERLLVQKLLAQEEQSRGAASDAEARAYFDAHRAEFGEPERIHLARVLVSVLPSASDAERQRARARAEKLWLRLQRGESLAQVAREGDGPERARDGDAGWLTRDDITDPALAQAAFALAKPGARSGVVATRDGLAVLTLLERRSAHEPSFEEARSRVLNRLDPARKRAVFDDLVARLRRTGMVQINVAAGR
jgi:parvulin-like peptidyl-prolyl isomerase